MRIIRKYLNLIIMMCLTINAVNTQAFGLKDVYKNLHINTTAPGNYQNAAAGWYCGGSSVVRTKNSAINPLSVTAPHLRTGCNGIDAFFGSFSMISSGEIINIMENMGSQAPVYAFHLGLKTYAPEIEQILKDLRNLQMELNQFGIGQCKATQAAFAAALPKNTAMYETVCGEMAAESGNDLGGQRKKCRDHAAQKAAVARAQERDPELLMDNYNLFIKVAKAVGIPPELHGPLMSMVGTIIVRDGVMVPYPSLANDARSLDIHINGGSGASMYSCNNSDCLMLTLHNNVNITSEASYAGLARARLNSLKVKLQNQTEEFSSEDKGFLDSIGNSFPVFDHITLEAASGVSILDGSSQVIARYMLLAHLNSVTRDIKKGVVGLKQKQINDKYLTEYERSLQQLLNFANLEWSAVMTDADRINDRAEKIEKHLIARERG